MTSTFRGADNDNPS